MMSFLAKHATQVGGGGDALVLGTIGGAQASATVFKLGHTRDHGMWQQYRRTRELNVVPASFHTIDGEAVASNVTERAIAIRMAASDWLDAFGSPEILQITEQVRSGFHTGTRVFSTE